MLYRRIYRRKRVATSISANTRRRVVRMLPALAIAAPLAAFAAPASANASSLTWAGQTSGHTESAAHWSNNANWENGVAPSSSQTIETLSFPHLTNGECTSEPETDTCYLTLNDLTGLTAESVQLDDADDYLLDGEGITIGSGGLTAAPGAGSSGSAGSFVLMPLHLGASQRWSVANRSGGNIEENGMLLASEITGAGSALTIELSQGPLLVMENNTEVGPVTIEGPDAGGEHIKNGVVLLEKGQINSSDREPVSLENVLFSGSGSVGKLSASNSTVVAGTGGEPAGRLETASFKMDSSSGLLLEVTGNKNVAGFDYGQLSAQGTVELAGTLVIVVGKPSENGSCPTLEPGRQFTFVSTTGTLSGSFSNAPEGGREIPIEYSASCSHPTQTMRIDYHRTGGIETVTGTVEALVAETREAEAGEHEAKEREAKEREARENEAAEKRQLEEHAKKVAEEMAVAEAATKKREAEEAANHKLVEEITHRGAGTIELPKSKRLTRSQLLAKALSQCKKQPARKRARCRAQAKKKYGPPTRHTGKRK
jgi:hypothetical protein